MTQTPGGSPQPEPLPPVPGADDASTYRWEYVEPVAPVLPQARRTRRRVSLAMGAAVVFVLVAVVSAVAMSLPSNPLTSAVAGADATPTPGPTSAIAQKGAMAQQACQDFLSNLSSRLNVSTDTLQQALTGAAGDTIDQMVGDGRLTSDQAAYLKGQLSNLASSPCSAVGRRGGAPGMMPFGREFGGERAGIDGTAILDAAASALGITRQTLLTELGALTQGQDLKTLATKHGVDYAKLTSAIHDAVKTQLDASVKAGTLSGSQETALLGRIDQQLANGGFPFGMGVRGGFGRGMGHGGWGGGWGGAPTNPAASPSATSQLPGA